MNEMKNLTVQQIIKACKKYPYLILRDRNGITYGHNSGICEMALRKHKWPLTQETKFMSLYPCSFNEYITEKIPFI